MKHDKEVKQAFITSALLIDDALTLDKKRLQTVMHCDVDTATLRC